MTVGPGTRVGPYEVSTLLGEGGMGKVWRARHAGLGRDDALKVLPDAFAADAERLRRFNREAQLLASLNHPNIAHVHGLEQVDGTAVLVMELVEGPTLADRIASGAIPFDEALPIAKQIADALEAAHEQGIIHRDLKPANIKLRPDGVVKVLDFGLAKATEQPSAAGIGATNSPTLSIAATQAGVILGTATYMSPEQARGRAVDKRIDVWAFGAVLYEMLAGQRAFDGEDITEVLGAVVRLEPRWDALPREVPPAVRTLIQRCLVKDPRHRIGDIAVPKFVLAELGNLAPSHIPVALPAALRPRWRPALPAAGAAALAAVVVGFGAWLLQPRPAPPAVTRFSFTLPEGLFFTGTSRPLVAISPDGTRVAYVANSRIYLRSVGELEPREIPGTGMGPQVWNPMFAPDGESIAFFESATLSTPYKLKRIPISGGTASTLATMRALPVDATWGRDGILFADGDEGILRVSPNGGAPEPVVTTAADEEAHTPQMLPGERALLFTVATRSNGRVEKSQIVVQSLDDGTRRVLIEDGFAARYLPTGHLLYADAGTILAVPFDAGRLTVTGAAVPVIVGVRRRNAAHLSVSETGALAYIPGPAAITTTAFNLVVGDGRGATALLALPAAAYEHPRVSPDGRTLAVGRIDGQDSNIWTYDLSGNSAIQRFTYGNNDRFPVWSADGGRVTFQSGREGDRAIWWQPVGGGPAERLTKPEAGQEHVPEAWSRDGRRLLFSVAQGSRNFLWVLTLDGRKAEPVGGIQSAEPLSASFSPDGRWVAYAFSETRGGSRETRGKTISPDRGVYVSPFPATGERQQAPKVSSDYHPLWSPDGKSLLYVAASGQSVVSVPVTTSPAIAFGTPVELPRGPRTDLRSTDRRGYDVLPNGRIVSVLPEFGEGVSAASGGEIRVVLHWFEELKRLAPP